MEAGGKSKADQEEHVPISSAEYLFVSSVDSLVLIAPSLWYISL